jgi:hypothetical protein
MNVLAANSRTDGRREWVNVGEWLYPGDAIVLVDSALSLSLQDCRLCANYTTNAGGCVSLVQCVDGAQFKGTTPRQYWTAGPNVMVSGGEAVRST